MITANEQIEEIKRVFGDVKPREVHTGDALVRTYSMQYEALTIELYFIIGAAGWSFRYLAGSIERRMGYDEPTLELVKEELIRSIESTCIYLKEKAEELYKAKAKLTGARRKQ